MRQANFKASGLRPEQRTSSMGEFRQCRVSGSCEGRAVGWRRKTVNKEDISRKNRNLVQDIPGWKHRL